jgi:DNA-binding IclR family transcriptional regulator
MTILELVVASEPTGLRLGDLASAIEAPKSSIHSLAKGLVAEGYLREAEGRYFLGPASSTLLTSSVATLPAVYRPALERLTEKWNETTMLATLLGDSLVYLDSVEPSDVLIRAAPHLNRRLPAWPRSAGKCLLAFSEERRLQAYLRRQHAPTDRASILAELDGVRESRIGLNIGESIADHIGIASPLVIPGRPVTLAIAIAGPKVRMENHVHEIAASVLGTAQGLHGSPS